MPSPPDLATLKLDDFAAHLDTDFEMQISGGVLPLKLVKADPAGAAGREGGAFSLLFAAPAGTSLPQAIYPVTHPVLGVLEIFLVPIGLVSGGNGYQAIFSWDRRAGKATGSRECAPDDRLRMPTYWWHNPESIFPEY